MYTIATPISVLLPLPTCEQETVEPIGINQNANTVQQRVANLQSALVLPNAHQQTANFIPATFKATHFGQLREDYHIGRKRNSPEVFSLLSQYLPRNICVLDLGCGTGAFTRPLSEKFSEVYGCDPDIQMLEIAKKSTNNPHLFVHGNAYQIPFGNEKFGLVTMSSTFHWYCNARAIKEISRVLQQHGFVYVIEGGGSSALKTDIQTTLEDAIGHALFNPKDGYDPEQVLEENGYTTISRKIFSITQTDTICESLSRIRSTSGWHDIQTAGKENAVMQQLLEIHQKHADSSGNVSFERIQEVLLMQKL